MTGLVLLSFVIAVSVLVLLGYLAASFFWPRGLSQGTLWAFAPATGAGICSLIFFIFRRPMFTIEFALLLILGIAWFVRRRPRLSHSDSSLRLPITCLLLAAIVGFVFAGLLSAVSRNPHGDWDAFAIWNSHARYLYRDGPGWEEHIQNTFQPDYPLLVPIMNARVWRYMGQEVPDTGGLLGIVLTLSGVAVLIATLIELRNMRLAMLMGLVLLGTPFYIDHGVSQAADVPLSLYFLSAIALLCLYSDRASGHPGLLILAGFMAGCASWTKNEGMLFVLAFSLMLLASGLTSPWMALRRFAAFGIGLFLPFAVMVYFKMAIAPPSELITNLHSAEIVEKLLTPDRYVDILVSFSQTLWSFGNWAVHPLVALLVFILIRGVNGAAIRNPGWLVGAGTLTLVFAGYFALYVITPYDLYWHLDSSAPRLFLQLWPSSLLLTGLLAVQ